MNIAKHAFALLLACASTAAFAQDSKATPEKIAVHTFGASDSSINKALGSKLLAEFAQSGRYAEIQNHYAFQDELAKSGNSGIGNITQAAKRHDADLVCAVSIVEVFGAYSITASIVKTSDSQVLKTVSLDRSIKSLDDLTAASKELARQLLGLGKETASEQAPSSWIRFQLPEEAAYPKPIIAAGFPMTMPVAQALSSTSLSKGCVEDFTNVLGKSDFSMTDFAKELAPAVAKTKLKLKSPFGKPKDNEMTSAGLTVGCIKTLPESPAEIQSLLKDISLKAGLSFAASAAADFAANEDNHASSKKEPFLEFGVLITQGNGNNGDFFRWSYSWFYNTIGYWQNVNEYDNSFERESVGYGFILGLTHRWAGETFGFGLFGGLGGSGGSGAEFVHELGMEVILGYVSLYLSERNFDRYGLGIGLTFWRDKK
ncbi:MAG: hypothetical protein LBH25_13815 [Fibromonadaceae bacterium]|jgi:hypothetical protein|nr:hypothetical protein [Fibromonadaceae bacterium]